jgi:hypothetical protein
MINPIQLSLNAGIDLFAKRALSIYIPGPQSDDKSIVLRELLSKWPIRVAFVRVSETYWSRNLFFEKILLQLKPSIAASKALDPLPNYSYGLTVLPKQRPGYITAESCGTTALFLEKLKHYLLSDEKTQIASERAYILIEDVDKLDTKVFGENILAVLLRIEELVCDLISPLA